MQIDVFQLGPLMTNGFLLSREGKAAFVDPGGDPARVLDVLRRNNLELTHVLVTHLHCDHIYGCKALADATGAAILSNPEDDYLWGEEVGGGGLMGLPMVDRFETQPLVPGEAEFLGLPCMVLGTPGHTPGSVTLHFPDAAAAFVGDLIFKRSIGRSDFPGGSQATLMASVREKIFTLPQDTVLHSGHGPETTVGDEQSHNPFFNGGF